MKKNGWIKILAGLSLLGFYSLSSAGIDISQRLQDFIAKTDAVSTSGKPTAEKANLIDAEYAENFGTRASTIPDDELAAFFAATQYVMFYTLDKSKLPLFEKIFDRLVDARQATPDQYRQLLEMYYALREFKKANSLIEQYNPNALQGPITVNDLASPSAQRTAWAFQEKRSLTRRVMNLQKGLRLVIIGSPYCGFTKRAVSQIESDPTLAPILREKVTVMAMPDFNFNYDAYTRWNQLHPSLPFTLTHSREEWPEVTHWVSPVFLFFRNGKLDSTFSGWGKGGDLNKVYRGFGITVSSVSELVSQ
ncbi:hypothetical protein PO883_09460 [Massilia sp. DJPM01]|uniref:hypothetical protein n=1 Tax=Massilia sp. DJPM01 TaxID=3024404 RepID=UPI00259F3E7A|nr:hypothetical protein [Massilia sp. DJPM01]MDM5177416.1 hypothetical protein [Massilia sp. DJPM01]